MGQKYDKSYAERAAAYARKKRAAAKTSDTPVATDTTATPPAPKRNLKREVAPGLTLGQLIAQTQAATQTKYHDASQQLANQPARINDWYGQYRQAISDAQTQQKADTAGAVDSVKNLQTGLDDASAKQWAGQQAAGAADAASRGATMDPKLADQAHNASSVRNVLTGSYGAMLANSGASENRYLGERKVNSDLGRIDALKQNAQQRVNLSKERGSFKQQFRSSAISDAVKNYLSTETAKALNQQRLASADQSKATTAKTKAETHQQELYNQYFEKYGKKPGTTLSPVEAYRLAYLKKHGYFPRTGPQPTPKDDGKDQYGNTPKDVERYQNQWARAKSTAKLLASPTDSVGDLSQLIIAKESTIPPWMAQAAAQQSVLTYVGPNLAKRLKSHGVTKGYGRKPATSAGGGTAVEGGGV